METVPENSIPGLSDSVVKIREDVKSGVENLTEECVSTMAAVTRLLMKLLPKALNCLPDAPQNQLHSLCFLISSSLNSAMEVRRYSKFYNAKPDEADDGVCTRAWRFFLSYFTIDVLSVLPLPQGLQKDLNFSFVVVSWPMHFSN
ncbi:uncharacterized protein LOC127150268 isoform X1 [Cucumis melo]|uniref:Uncharacterized protein LOC127145936 isoform X3 n=1 Tax=Cucumis melo TaxID=3656 RepID=A0ABM3L0Q1_CUCME|nr:uncharacterized protein LOC127145936 isoform X3 [Cucumis melo]XP_050936681.1 uncharacterized protein LOC127145936 isoform X3 [Cucumis melo]XP_050936684.1 uncharacterized protein LOC127145937 isoform X1 [Cucumis melo]XP_050936685.1 uncharacterized protein LOC127145937 isoform X1 [Cucumis melo]XP_050939244.1 uncharacterized protein LOC127148885 isoform X2 [Cucumis melo]XP_050939245.1 uncharacterized protein LOC127148885 isoform X2 [Cucumis melo]XP_050939249.1 uncharacterized protein LOC12714